MTEASQLMYSSNCCNLGARSGGATEGSGGQRGTYLGSSGFEKPVEAEAPGLADLCLELIPGPVAQLVHHAQDEAVLLLGVRLALVGPVRQLKLLRPKGQSAPLSGASALK